MSAARIIAALAVFAPLAAAADPGPHLDTGGVRQEAGASAAVGAESAGIAVWVDKKETNRVVTMDYVYRWQGISTETGRHRIIFARPNFRLFFRSTSSADVITRGGAAVGLGFNLGLAARLGPADGRFSLVLGPMAGFDAFWVIREGSSGLSARVPLGAEVGVEAKIGRLLPFVLARPYVDVWPHRAPAYRYEAFAGVGVSFDVPKNWPAHR